MRLFAPLLTLLLLAPVPARTAPPLLPASERVDDGPHVLWEGPKARVIRWRQGQPEETALPASGLLALDGLPPLRLDPAPAPPRAAAFPLPAAIAAVSDIHGNYPALVTLLTRQGIVGKDLRWTFGKGHLVVVGDSVDRGGQVTEVIWLLRSLEQQAGNAGGQVHVLLGNHELMDMKGDIRYVNAKYKSLPFTVPYLLGPDSEIGRWIRGLPVALRLGDILFVHGGISPRMAEFFPDLESMNATARQKMPMAKKALLGGDGPLWYRGLVPGTDRAAEPTEAELKDILDCYKVRTIVVGHTTLPRVTAFHGSRVFDIDAGLCEGRAGELWLQLDGRRYRGLADGKREPLD